MMKLYYSTKSSSLVAHIIINELNLDCEFEYVDLITCRTEKGYDLCKLSLTGAVPLLVTDDNQVITENIVIQQYLIDKYKATSLLPPVGDLNRYKILEYYNWLSFNVRKYLTIIVYLPPETSHAFMQDVLQPIIRSKFSTINNNLGKSKYLHGEEFTVSDAYLIWILTLATKFLNININEFANLTRFFEELKNRRSILKALQEEGI